MRRGAGGDDLDLGFEFFAEVSGDEGANGWDEEEEADGIGQEAGGDEDGSGEEDHDAIEGFASGEFSFAGGLLEFLHGADALGFGQGGADDGGDDDDAEGFGEAELLTQGHEEVELGQGDEDEEDEKFAEHDAAGNLKREEDIATTKKGGKKNGHFPRGDFGRGGE